MTLKERIEKAASEFVKVRSLEIASLNYGTVAVWVNGKRFGTYDINKNEFVEFMF